MDDRVGILISQYMVSLEMLQQTITNCPESIRNRTSDKNRFWSVAYHALFFTHLYVADSEESFIPWAKHRDGYEDLELPQTAEPYDKDTILEHLAFCQRHVAERVPQLNLEGSFDRRWSYNKLELQIYSIRHMMQHVGELLERLGPMAQEIDWVGWARG